MAERAEFSGAGYFVHSYIAWLLAQFGAIDRATAVIEQTRTVWDEHDPTVGFLYGVQAVIAGLRGDFEKAVPLARNALASVNAESLNPEFLGYATMLRAEMMLLEQKFDATLEDVDRSLERLGTIGISYFEPPLRLRRAQALRGLGRLDEAAESLEAARHAAERMEMHLTLMWILIEMAELANERQDQAPNDAVQQSIRHIADRMGDEQLRQIFLSQPRIRALVEV